MTIARARANALAIVRVHEPTGASDPQTGLTSMLVTHDPGAGTRCDRIAWMRDGVIGAEERPESLVLTTVATRVMGAGHGDG